MSEHQFTTADTVKFYDPSDFYGTAIWYDEDGDYAEKPELELPENGEYEIVMVEYDAQEGWVYNLRLDGEIDEFDYIRVFGVGEESLYKK